MKWFAWPHIALFHAYIPKYVCATLYDGDGGKRRGGRRRESGKKGEVRRFLYCLLVRLILITSVPVYPLERRNSDFNYLIIVPLAEGIC